jgi:hypothetical protein
VKFLKFPFVCLAAHESKFQWCAREIPRECQTSTATPAVPGDLPVISWGSDAFAAMSVLVRQCDGSLRPECLAARLFVICFWLACIIGNDARKKSQFNNHFTIRAHPEIKCPEIIFAM